MDPRSFAVLPQAGGWAESFLHLQAERFQWLAAGGKQQRQPRRIGLVVSAAVFLCSMLRLFDFRLFGRCC